MSTHRAIGLVCGAATAIVALIVAPAALADTYKPNKLGDHTPSGCTHSDCTLREAVIKANNHPGADAIVLRSRKTYTLSRVGYDATAQAGDLDVTGTLSIAPTGKPKAKIDAIDGGSDTNLADRILEIIGERRLTLRSLALVDGGPVGGVDGGAIQVGSGSLRLIRSTLKHNAAEGFGAVGVGTGDALIERSNVSRNGISSYGVIGSHGGGLRIVRSTVAHNQGDRGAITAFASSSLHVVRSRIVDNASAGLGGGIYLEGNGVISKSTIAQNHGAATGGGIDNFGDLQVRDSTINSNEAKAGGGIESEDAGASTTVVNSTISKNSAATSGGGIDGVAGALELRSVTVARNHAGSNPSDQGGGLASEGAFPFTLRNSIVALNSIVAGGSGPDCSGTLTSKGRNLFTDLSGCGDFHTPPNLVRSNPHLGQLADNGGPTKTIALLRHSAAINNAGAGSPPRDQRGVKRHNPDIGAYERR